MLTSSDAKFRCMWYMVVWSVLLMFMSQFLNATNVVAFYIFASATMLLLLLVTSIQHNSGQSWRRPPQVLDHYWYCYVCQDSST